MKKNIYTFTLIGLCLFMLNSCELDDILGESDDPRDNIEATWQVDEQSEFFKSKKSFYLVDLNKHPTDSTKVVLANFYQLGSGVEVVATYSNNTLRISNFKTTGNFTINGTGNVSSNYKEIEWEYRVDDGSGEIDNVTATYTRL